MIVVAPTPNIRTCSNHEMVREGSVSGGWFYQSLLNMIRICWYVLAFRVWGLGGYMEAWAPVDVRVHVPNNNLLSVG